MPAGCQTELTVATQLENTRSEGEHFQGLSFPTIAVTRNTAPSFTTASPASARNSDPRVSSAGLGCAIPGWRDRYHAHAAAGRPGDQGAEEKLHIGLKGILRSRPQIPGGCDRARLDTFARQYLWAAGRTMRTALVMG